MEADAASQPGTFKFRAAQGNPFDADGVGDLFPECPGEMIVHEIDDVVFRLEENDFPISWQRHIGIAFVIHEIRRIQFHISGKEGEFYQKTLIHRLLSPP